MVVWSSTGTEELLRSVESSQYEIFLKSMWSSTIGIVPVSTVAMYVSTSVELSVVKVHSEILSNPLRHKCCGRGTRCGLKGIAKDKTCIKGTIMKKSLHVIMAYTRRIMVLYNRSMSNTTTNIHTC